MDASQSIEWNDHAQRMNQPKAAFYCLEAALSSARETFFIEFSVSNVSFKMFLLEFLGGSKLEIKIDTNGTIVGCN